MDYKRVFQPDSGMLLDIVVFDVQLSDWEHLLAFLSRSYSVFYSEDGVSAPLPDIGTIFENRLKRSVTLEILLPGFTLNSHFFIPNEIEIDLLPEDVDSEEKASAVFDLMLGIAKCLGKQVFLAPESCRPNLEVVHEFAICVADPHGDLQHRL